MNQCINWVNLRIHHTIRYDVEQQPEFYEAYLHCQEACCHIPLDYFPDPHMWHQDQINRNEIANAKQDSGDFTHQIHLIDCVQLSCSGQK